MLARARCRAQEARHPHADFPDSRLIFTLLPRRPRRLRGNGGCLHTAVPMIALKTAYEASRAHKALSILLTLHFINSIPTGFRVRMVSVLRLSYEWIRSGHMK